MAFTHTQHVMRNGLSASSNLDKKSLKSLINGYFYMTIFQISKRLNRAKMHSISYIGCKKFTQTLIILVESFLTELVA